MLIFMFQMLSGNATLGLTAPILFHYALRFVDATTFTALDQTCLVDKRHPGYLSKGGNIGQGGFSLLNT